MIIENPDALLQWLTSYLTPLCDADPEVLAKYCLALVRKDRPNNELRASMLEQLDIFLKSNTESFVDKFLQVAKSKTYLQKVSETTSASAATTAGTSSFSQAENSPDSTTASVSQSNVGSIPSPSSNTNNISTTTQPPLPPLPPLPPPVSSIPHPPPETTPPYPPPKKEEVSSSVKPRKSDAEREDRRTRLSSRSRAHSRSRSRDKTRSRSRERERTRRSRSRGRSNRSKYEDRRRRSPHLKRYRRTRTRSRSPRWSRSPNRRSRSRDRHSRSRNRSRSVTPKRHHSRHKSRSRSPLLTSHPPSPLTKGSPGKEDKERSASPEPGTDSLAIVHSVVSVPPNQDAYSSTKTQRCRDYDVQGFCMKGDQCPYDHGADRVVLEGGALDFPPPMPGVPPIPPVSNVVYPLPGVTNATLLQDIPGRPYLRHPPPPRPPQYGGEYTPNNPGLWSADVLPSVSVYYSARGRGIGGPPPRFPGPPPSHPVPTIDRELISIPVNCANDTKPGIRPSLAQRLGPAASVPFSTNYSNSSGKPSGTKYGNSSDNCTLELRKIPPGLNTIAHLNQHFFKFGTIINIQVQHAGDPESALVTFSSNSEASAAYRSTEAVLNNRFIKLFWHNGAKSDVAATTITAQRSIHERLGVRNPNKSLVNKAPTTDIVVTSESSDKVTVNRGSLVKTVYNSYATREPNSTSRVSTELESQTNNLPVAASSQPSGAEVVSRLRTSDTTAEEPPKKQLTTVEMKKQEIEAIQRQQELLKAELAAKHKVEKQKAEAIKLKNEVELRTKQLLREQMQHVKLLINKLEKNKSTMKSTEIKIMIETIKSLQAAVESTKAQLATTTTAAVAVPQIKSKSQLDKEILDTELELYTLQSEGRDAMHVRTRLLQLKAQASMFIGKYSKSYIPGTTSSTIFPSKHVPYAVGRGRGVPRAFGVIRGRGRGIGLLGEVSAVDRRTTCISASGFEREDKDQVLAHFSSLGNVTNYAWDDLTPAVSVQYASRREAEKAMERGRTLGDRLLTITWVAESALFTSVRQANDTPTEISASILQQKGSSFVRSTTPPSTPSVTSNDEGEEITEEIVEEETEEIGSIIYEDEIEDDEDEGRSWRH